MPSSTSRSSATRSSALRKPVKPVRKRSQTHAVRRKSTVRQFSVAPIKARLKALALPAWSIQRALAALIAVVCLFALLSLFVSPGWAITSIDVQGNEGVATQDIVDAASFVSGRNAFVLRTAEVVKAIKAIPAVTGVDVGVQLPDTLLVTITDTRPDVAWLSGNLLYWVDNNGVVLEPKAPTAERRLTIRDLNSQTYQKNDVVDAQAIQAAQKLMALAPKDIQSFEYQRQGELIVVGAKGWRAQINTRGSLNEQLKTLRKVLAALPAVTYVDVRVPSLPTYK